MVNPYTNRNTRVIKPSGILGVFDSLANQFQALASFQSRALDIGNL